MTAVKESPILIYLGLPNVITASMAVDVVIRGRSKLIVIDTLDCRTYDDLHWTSDMRRVQTYIDRPRHTGALPRSHRIRCTRCGASATDTDKCRACGGRTEVGKTSEGPSAATRKRLRARR